METDKLPYRSPRTKEGHSRSVDLILIISSLQTELTNTVSYFMNLLIAPSSPMCLAVTPGVSFFVPNLFPRRTHNRNLHLSPLTIN